MTLRDCLESLPPDTLLADGGTTATAEYWLDAYDVDALDSDAAMGYRGEQYVIERIGGDGYRVSPPELTEVRS